MNEYYKDELLNLVDSWTNDQLQKYILELEERLEFNKDQLRALRSLRRRKTKYKNVKDTGDRSGK